MKTFTLIPAKFGCGSTLMLITAWVISGCSGSSDSVATDIQESVVGSSSVVSNNSVSESSNEAQITNGSITVVELEPGAGINAEENVDVMAPELLDNAPDVADLEVRNRILVTFDITVPAYQSDALSVELNWGEVYLTAAWIGDEFWTASTELPIETEELLSVTFFDDNGALELAKFSQEFRTGSNAMEAFQISVEQFNADQFDNDGDGISNLDELISGSDPTIDEDSSLEILDAFRLFMGSQISVTSELERLLSAERPITTANQEQIDSSVTIDTDIQIDLEGNGTLSRIPISWEASRTDFDCDFTLRSALTNTVTVIDENTRTFVEDVDAVRTGSFTNSWESSANITGQLIEGTSFCKAVSGTFSETFVDNSSGQTIFVTFVSKNIDDPYWRVNVERRERINFLTPDNFDVTTTEHFVRDIHFSHNVSNNPTEFTTDDPTVFKCDFVDI